MKFKSILIAAIITSICAIAPVTAGAGGWQMEYKPLQPTFTDRLSLAIIEKQRKNNGCSLDPSGGNGNSAGSSSSAPLSLDNLIQIDNTGNMWLQTNGGSQNLGSVTAGNGGDINSTSGNNSPISK
jgi:hypothetical protein